jgi:predicted nucleic acid-binding protein
MQIEKIVINASPLILLFKSHFEWLLPKLFNEIIVPEAVWDEVSRGEDIASHKLYDYELEWITRGLVQIPEEILIWNLGDGESEVLSWARNNEKKYRAVIDDRAARNCAKTLGIPTLGTGGILVLAKKRGLISSVGDTLNRLQNVGLYISDDIIELLKKQANEI